MENDADTRRICGSSRDGEEKVNEVEDGSGEMGFDAVWAWGRRRERGLELEKVEIRSLEGCQGVLGEGTDLGTVGRHE